VDAKLTKKLGVQCLAGLVLNSSDGPETFSKLKLLKNRSQFQYDRARNTLAKIYGMRVTSDIEECPTCSWRRLFARAKATPSCPLPAEPVGLEGGKPNTCHLSQADHCG